VVAKARELEEKAVDFYETAAVKIKALPDVARALKTMGKKRKGHLERLAQI
jgi:rubrerythrin